MKVPGRDDKEGMEESAEELHRRVARAMRAEKEALERLRDIIHKYRVALPFMFNRTETLNERLKLITTHRDECNTSLAALRGKITLIQHKLKETISAHEAARQTAKVLVAQYTGMMEGKFPCSFAPEEKTGSLADKKVKFMERLSGEMDRLQKQAEAAEVEQAQLAEERKRLKARLTKLAKRAGLLETKLAIYQKDIRDIILDLNSQMRNEQALTDDYAKLVDMMKKIQSLTDWGEKVFREAVKAKLPDSGFLELAAPLEKTVQILPLNNQSKGSRRAGPLQ